MFTNLSELRREVGWDEGAEVDGEVKDREEGLKLTRLFGQLELVTWLLIIQFIFHFHKIIIKSFRVSHISCLVETDKIKQLIGQGLNDIL